MDTSREGIIAVFALDAAASRCRCDVGLVVQHDVRVAAGGLV